MNKGKNKDNNFNSGNSGIGYKNSKYRPSVFIDADKKDVILERVKELEYKSFNTYINCLINKDLKDNIL